MPPRGVLQKKGGGRVVTWHWRYCVLHPSALVVHEGTDSPGPIRSSILIKDIMLVTPDADAGGRPFALSVQTAERTFVFCAMSKEDLDTWCASIRTNMGQKGALRQKYNLEDVPDSAPGKKEAERRTSGKGSKSIQPKKKTGGMMGR